MLIRLLADVSSKKMVSGYELCSYSEVEDEL